MARASRITTPQLPTISSCSRGAFNGVAMVRAWASKRSQQAAPALAQMRKRRGARRRGAAQRPARWQPHPSHLGQHGEREDDAQREEEHGGGACRPSRRGQGVRASGRNLSSKIRVPKRLTQPLPSALRRTAAVPEPGGGIGPLRGDGRAKRLTHLRQAGVRPAVRWGASLAGLTEAHPR